MSHNPNCLFFMETKCKRDRLRNIRDKLGYSEIFVVDPVGRAKGLALMWNREIDIDIYPSTD